MLFCKNLGETPSPKCGGTSTTMSDKSTSSKAPAAVAAETPQESARPRKIYPIVKYGDPILEQPGAPVKEFGPELEELAEDMFASMYAAQGVGLADPQITHAEGEVREEEGCLSIPGFRGYVVRPQFVTVKAQNARGEPFEIRGENMLARAFCHEIDHLDGILFLQHLGMLKRDLIKRKIKKLKKQGEW